MDGAADLTRRMLAVSRDVVVLVRPDGGIMAVGPSAEAVTGFSEEELIGRNGLELVHPEDRSIAIDALDSAVRQPGPGFEHLHVRLLLADGTWRVVEGVLDNRIDDPAIGGLVVTLRDRHDDPEIERRVGEREDRYRQIAELSLDGVWCIDDQWVTTFVTKRMAAMLGHEVEDMLGRPVFDFAFPEDRQLAVGLLERKRQGITDEHRSRFRHRDGHEVWVLMSTSPTHDEHGRVNGAIALVSDLTEQIVAGQLLAESEAARHAVIDALPDVLFLVSDDHVVLDRHAGADHPPLLQADLYLGHSVRALIPDHADEAEAAIDEALRTGSVTSFEFTFRVDGEVMAYEARASRIAEDRALILVRDVTEVRAAERAAEEVALEVRRREAAEERADLERQLGRAARLEALGRLAGGVAHDMNNLLGVVGNYAAAIRGSSGDERTALDALEIERAVRRGTELTRRLLQFGRREGASVRVHDIRAVIGGVCSMLTRTLGPNHPLQVRYEVGPTWAAVDRWQLEQAVINLVINAQDASAPGDPIVVALSADPGPSGGAGPWLRLSVTDRGPGMPSAVRERAFEPFFTTKGPDRGSGLGLAVVQGMAQESGGRVEIVCPDGGGTTVSILLPLAASAPAVPEREPAAPAAPESSRPAARLLVVDDEEDARRSISRLLVARGFEVAEADSGDRALEVLSAVADIDAVVTDVAMLGVSGPVLADRIRTDFPDLPVVMVTGYGADLLDDVPPDVQVLPKPLQVEQLVSTLSRLLATA